jgi:AraC-like DNA-binding protein
MQLDYCGLLPEARRSTDPHVHNIYEFHYVVGGHGAFEVRRHSFAIGLGDMFYTRPGSEHRVLPADGEYLLQYIAWLRLEPAHDAAVAGDLVGGFAEGLARRVGDRYHVLFANLSRMCDAADPWQQRAAAFKFVDMLYDLMAGLPPASRFHPAVVRALELVRARVSEAYTLDALVRELGIEKSYFIRLFKKSVGVSPMKYAMDLKMRAAADLLRGTREPLAWVAARLGFADEYYFARCFKQWSGMAPGAYRRGR